MNVISIKEILNLSINILINFIVAVNVLWSQQIFPILYEKKNHNVRSIWATQKSLRKLTH